jgi:hypothetical protein
VLSELVSCHIQDLLGGPDSEDLLVQLPDQAVNVIVKLGYSCLRHYGLLARTHPLPNLQGTLESVHEYFLLKRGQHLLQALHLGPHLFCPRGLEQPGGLGMHASRGWTTGTASGCGRTLSQSSWSG